ncbi:Integrase, catalytic core protein [Phytophthora cinnamomi]|uniref:Integrase, catalytic core protein n=1 Tax=Phytophthora cinnamomi TaxID=4785 RepID=UPI0035594E3E|nr:Integrase, catalytic core protein [Phytophthora cinnamomi]
MSSGQQQHQNPPVGRQQQQQVVASGGAGGRTTTRRVCGSKPPKYNNEGGFDLYHAQIEGYLRQHECRDVVDGNGVPADPNNQQWAERNQFARCALLFSMLPKDSKKVCKMANAREMWRSFEQDRAKRAYASEIRLRGKLYTTKFKTGEDMEKYLEKLEDMRRQLTNMNAAIADEEMSRIVLQGAMDSHRNVVRLFNHNAGGNAPDLTTVVNTLLGEAETDKACAVNATKNEGTTKLMVQTPVTQNPKSKFKKKGGSGKKVTQENRKCFFCKKKGHLRADCYGWKALQKKEQSFDQAGSSDKPTPLKMVWSGELGDSNNPPVPIRMVRGQSDIRCTTDRVHDWMLDSGAGAHVCVNEGSFVKMNRNPLLTLDWKGGVKVNENSGLIQLLLSGVILELPEARYAPDGAVNLISQRLLERTGWRPSYSDTDDEQQRMKNFDKDGVRLEFTKKPDGFYWMTASPILETALTVCRAVETLEDNIVMKWNLKLAHLNEAAMKQMVREGMTAMKQMVREGMTDGMGGLTLHDFKKTPLKCIACQEAKAKRMSFKRQQGKRAKECGACIMSDVCHVGITTPGGAKYFQLIQDEASRFKWVFLIAKKGDAKDNVLDLLRQLKKDFKIKLFRSDQGGEFINTKLEMFFREERIRVLPTNAYTPEENCLVEKLNGKLMSKVRAFSEAANLPECLWGEVLHYVVHVDNMSATKALGDVTPYQRLWGQKPDMKNLKMVVWARELVMELGFGDPYPQVPVYCDNQGTIAVVANNGNTSRIRHMAKHARSINEYVDEQVLEVMYVPSAENLADVFTNALGPAEFERQRSGLNIEDVTTAWAKVEATVEPVKSHTSSSAGVDVDMEESHASSSTEMDIDMEEC